MTITDAQWRHMAKTGNLASDLADDPAGLCPARCDTGRYWGHDYVKQEDGPPVCGYCGRVED